MSPRVKGALLLTVSFALGCATGGLGSRLALDRGAFWRGDLERPARSEQVILGRLTRELALRPEQARSVDAILREVGQDFRRLRDEIGPRFAEIRTRGEERIRAVLDREQQAKFADLVAKWQRRAERWHGRDPGRGGGEANGRRGESHP